MGGKVNYTLVGIFIVFLTGALVAIGVILTGSRHSEKYYTYLVYMNEAVSGLSEQAPVKYNGVEVGYVGKISLDPQNLQQVELALKIKQGTPITTSTVATLMAQGVTGITYVGLKSTSPKAPLLIPKSSPPYPVIKSVPSLLVQLDTALREVTDNLQDISQVFLKTFDKENQTKIKASFKNIAQFTNTLSSNSKQIDNILNNTSKASNDLPSVMNKLKETLNNAQQTAQKLSTASDEIKLTMQNGRAVVQNVSQQTVPALTESLQHLDQLLANLEQLTNDLKRNPSMLLRGVQLPPPGPGEKP